MSGSKKSPSVSKAELAQMYRQALKLGVPLEHVTAKIAKYQSRFETVQKVDESLEKDRLSMLQKQVPLVVRLMSWLIPVGFVSIGVGLIGSAVLPILVQLISRTPQLQAAQLMAPIPQEQVLDIVPAVITAPNSDSLAELPDDGPTILDVQLDYTNLSNWFDAPIPSGVVDTREDTYVLDIPKLKVMNAVVKIGGTNLNQSLIQYPGTADPGQPGAPVLFGHSVLRQFYNPSEKNPNRYNSIFSYIMTLQTGDPIYVTYRGVKYTYVVREKTEVKPEDTYILAQRRDAQLLKLVTCTPEGTYLRRGVVTAQLVDK